jgi:hypothetical protein
MERRVRPIRTLKKYDASTMPVSGGRKIAKNQPSSLAKAPAGENRPRKNLQKEQSGADY